MTVYRQSLAFASILAASAACAQSDWRPVNVSPIAVAQKAQLTFSHFAGVDGAVSANIVLPQGKGNARLNPQWRSPAVFRLEYPVVTSWTKKTIYAREILVSDGSGRMVRIGDGPGPKKVAKKDPYFNYQSDAALVAAWPREFARLLFTPFVGGNATLLRVVKALAAGVGGYKVHVDQRDVLYNNRDVRDYRIFADRPAKGNLPASRIEMIFDADIGLPVNIHCTTKGLDYAWLCRWRNHQTFPDANFSIAR